MADWLRVEAIHGKTGCWRLQTTLARAGFHAQRRPSPSSPESALVRGLAKRNGKRSIVPQALHPCQRLRFHIQPRVLDPLEAVLALLDNLVENPLACV